MDSSSQQDDAAMRILEIEAKDTIKLKSARVRTAICKHDKLLLQTNVASTENAVASLTPSRGLCYFCAAKHKTILLVADMKMLRRCITHLDR